MDAGVRGVWFCEIGLVYLVFDHLSRDVGGCWVMHQRLLAWVH